MKISKDIKFDCAHMLPNYTGKCNNLHGHTYHGTVTIEAAVDDDTCMVLDYNKIKEVVDEYDHALVFSTYSYRDTAESALLKWAQTFEKKFICVRKGKATAESMASDIASDIAAYVLRPCTVTVKLSETDGSWAEETFKKQENKCK